MEAARTPVPVPLRYERTGSGYLLKLASDDSLVARVRAGNERAFAVIYERHFRDILAFCRHMLGSRDDAEDVVQQTFVSAYRDMVRESKELKLRPWLYRIARNHCIDTLRRRRPEAELDGAQASVSGLAEEVGGRSELRALLADLTRLPRDQREALVLAELHDNSHAEVAEILGCEKDKVKSLVFQARSSLIKSREARQLSCDDVRLQLSSLRGSALRRGALGRHLAQCDGCRAFRAELVRQRQQLAVLLAVVPTSTLKFGAATAVAAASTKAGAAGIGSATAAGSVTATGAAPAAAATGAGGGSLAALTAKVATSGIVLKGITTVTAVGVLAAGGVVGVKRVGDTVRDGTEQTQNQVLRDQGASAGSGRPAIRETDARQPARGARSSRPLRGQRRGDTAPAREHKPRGAPGTPFSQRSPRGSGRHNGAARGGLRRADPRNELRSGRRRRAERRKAPVRRERPAATPTPSDGPAERFPPQVPEDEPTGTTIP